ncbi:MAG TPA: hypothetical protein VFX96_05685 [Pyrinomonadaceae bacterium]|nr:hypothetical protein [Pyrinomonadaceae bacterium]
MPNARINVSFATAARRLVAVVACCTLLTACPPEGGRLAPVAGGDGSSRVVARPEGEALEVAREGVKIIAGGRWSVADAATSVILDVTNTNAEELTIDFGRAEVALGDAGQRLTLRSLADEGAPGGPAAFLKERVVAVGGGRGNQFALEFRLDAGDGRMGVPRNVRGQVATLRIPVEVRRATPAQVDFVFEFKYSNYPER